jgi:mono/diheme cytochrome c family protein
VTELRGSLARRRAFFGVVAVVVGCLTAGCGAVAHMTADQGDPARGKEIFKMPTLDGQPGCGTCHTLANAGTTGTVGPNLDTTFGIVRAQGFDVSTIRDVVRGQIAYPETETAEGGTGMPANLVTGQDARDVADYVAECAQLPAQDAKDAGFDTPEEPPDSCS